MASSLPFQNLTAIAGQLASGQVSSIEVTQAVIDQTQAVDDRVNAFISTDSADALAQATAADQRRAAGESRGPLDGVPIAMKDVIAVRDQPLTAGSKMLENFISPYDATVTTKLKDAGVVLWGRANCDEFAMGSSTENSAFKTTANP